MQTYQLSYVKNTKYGRAILAILLIPSLFLGWTGVFHFNEYQQFVPLWFFLPLLLLLASFMLEVSIGYKKNVLTTSINFAKWPIESTKMKYELNRGVVFTAINTKIKGEVQLVVNEKPIEIYLTGNFERHLVILNGIFGKG